MNTPLASPSQIRSGTAGSVRYMQAGKGNALGIRLQQEWHHGPDA
jgi:hypothetical protein